MGPVDGGGDERVGSNRSFSGHCSLKLSIHAALGGREGLGEWRVCPDVAMVTAIYVCVW